VTLTVHAGVIASGPTLSSVFFLVHTPDALRRLTDEIRAGPGLNQCNFLRACVDETQRMVPGVATILPRVVLPGGMVVGGEHIPEGTIVGSSNYVMHRNPDYFSEPDTFQPERWMSGGDLVPPESRRALFPFGHGPRSCSGVHLALAELKLVVAKAVFVYDMRLAPDAPCCKSSPGGRCTDREFKSYVGISTDGPMVQFRAREQNAG
jgi:cytochrome P450